MQTGINLFTLRDVEEALPFVIERVADAGYDGVEFLHRLPDAEIDAVVEALDHTGLAVPGAHLGPFVDLDEKATVLDETIELYETVGCETLAVSVGEERLNESAALRATAERLMSMADRTIGHDIDLLYHNHHWEFQPLEALDGAAPFDQLLELIDDRVGIEFDVGWAAAGGGDPVEYVHELGNRLEVLHVKDVDVDRKASVEVGEGDVDLAACVEAARDEGVDWYVYEHDDPDDPLASLLTGAEYLDRLR